MNYLPLILIATMLLKNSSDFKNILSSIDLEGLSPLLSLTGLDASALESVKALLNSNGDLKTLLPLIMKGFLKSDTPQRESAKPQEFEPILDVASAEIISALGNYFSN